MGKLAFITYLVIVAQRYGAIVEYDGTDFLGYQVQAKGRTIQGEIEKSLEKVTGEIVRITGAGRTDAGVHATGQIVAFNVGWRHTVSDLHRALNATLPPDIVVSDLKIVDQRFHPRFSALSRTYHYHVINQAWPAVLQRRYAQHVREALDIEAMNQAAAYLLGSQDFASFGNPPEGNVTIRNVTRAWWVAEKHRLLFEITANAFLYRMVRKIVGTLIQVGLGRLTVTDFREILEARDLRQSAPPAPACGLCLVRVSYPEDIWGTL